MVRNGLSNGSRSFMVDSGSWCRSANGQSCNNYFHMGEYSYGRIVIHIGD